MLGVGWGGDYAVVGSLMLGLVIGKAVSSKNECDTVNTTLQEQRLERPHWRPQCAHEQTHEYSLRKAACAVLLSEPRPDGETVRRKESVFLSTMATW